MYELRDNLCGVKRARANLAVAKTKP